MWPFNKKPVKNEQTITKLRDDDNRIIWTVEDDSKYYIALSCPFGARPELNDLDVLNDRFIVTMWCYTGEYYSHKYILCRKLDSDISYKLRSTLT